jgi:hypothetical protein
MRAIQIRAPILYNKRLLGDFKNKVAKKEYPGEQAGILRFSASLIRLQESKPLPCHFSTGEPLWPSLPILFKARWTS